MSRATIILSNDLLDELMRVLPAKSKTEAVTIAISKEIRRKKLEKIKAMTGKMEFDVTAEALRHHDDRFG